MRLLVCTQTVDRNDPDLGFFHSWLQEFAKHCEKVIVICLQEGEHALPQNVEVYSLGKEKGTPRLVRWARALRYIVVLRKKYDAVFVHMNPEYVVLGGLLWRLWRKKVVLWYVHRSVTFKLRIATFFASAIATASKESFRLNNKKVKIIGHGIDTEFFSPALHVKGNHLLSVGRLSKTKRHDLVIRVAGLLPGVTLQIAGEGPEEQNLRELVKDLGIERRVVFLGPRRYAEMPGIYHNAGVLVHMSETGSMDKVVLEALACGIPVVSTSEAFADEVLTVRITKPERIPIVVEEILYASHDPQALAEPVRRLHGLPQCIGRILSLYA